MQQIRCTAKGSYCKEVNLRIGNSTRWLEDGWVMYFGIEGEVIYACPSHKPDLTFLSGP